MRTRSLGATITALAMVQGGCVAVDDAVDHEPVVQDSAGVRIVEYPGAIQTEGAAPVLLWTHGHGPEDYQFQFVFLGALEPSGHVVVGDGGNREVVRIGPDGSDFEVIARGGQGPSEVRQPRGVVTGANGRFWVEDPGNGKILEFSGGQLVSSIDSRSTPEISRGAMPVAATEGGELLMVTASFRSDHDEPWLPGYLTVMPPDASALDTVGSYDMAPRSAPEGQENPFSPFGEATGAGDGWVHVRSDVPEVTWRSSDGAPVQVVRWRPDLRYPDDALWTAFQEDLGANLVRVNPQMDAAAVDAFVEQQLARYAVDERTPLPLFGPVAAGTDGDVWLPEYEGRTRHARVYTVFSPGGDHARVVTFDRPVSVLAASSGRVLAQFVDELDVVALGVFTYDLGW